MTPSQFLKYFVQAHTQTWRDSKKKTAVKMPHVTIHFNVYLHLKYQTSLSPTCSYHVSELFPFKRCISVIHLKRLSSEHCRQSEGGLQLLWELLHPSIQTKCRASCTRCPWQWHRSAVVSIVCSYKLCKKCSQLPCTQALRLWDLMQSAT